LDDLGRVISWLHGKARGTSHRLLRRLGIRYKRGRQYVHSPDLAYDAKLAAITAAQLLTHANPEAVVLLYEDEFTFYRRPTVSRGWAPVGADAPRVHQAWRTNGKRRVAACLDALSGRLITWQRSRFDRRNLLRYYQDVVAAYPAAEVIYLVQDNWPVHFHPELLAGLPPQLTLLALPTYAPWTNPVEDVWRGLLGDILHHHDFGDDWVSVQVAVTTWLGQWHEGSSDLLRQVGLEPWSG
jgi:hypothetical protein